MTFDESLDELMSDTVTIEPWVSQDADLKPTYGTAVTYPAFIELNEQRLSDSEGREFVSRCRVLLKDRLAIDKRSRVTLPSGFDPQTPAIRAVFAHKAAGLDHTVLVLGVGGEFSGQ